ncbi:MAG TPA: GTP-binding protein [Crinalium sp.]
MQYPQVVHTSRIQIESADILLLNKVDLVSEPELVTITDKLHHLNEIASIIPTVRCQIDPDLLFGIGRNRLQASPHHRHQPEFESFSYTSQAIYDRSCFTHFADSLSPHVYRAKGFVQFPEGTHLFNFVAGRWDLEPFEPSTTELVFIGKQITQQKPELCDRLKSCVQK